MQTNWIGRSEGAEIAFSVAPDASQPGGDQIRVFTTRPDTLFGATFMVLAPEHPLVDKLTHDAQRDDVDKYRAETRRKSRWTAWLPTARRPACRSDRMPSIPSAASASPSGSPTTCSRATAPGPSWPCPPTTSGTSPSPSGSACPSDAWLPHRACRTSRSHRRTRAPRGILVDSGDFSGRPAAEGGRAITEALASAGAGKSTVSYRLRDWLISRQRAWGTPIPVVYCEGACGMVPLPEEQLPVLLPDDYEIRSQGGNALESDEHFLAAECPRCGGPARRETDTMDTFVDSAWYWWRYLAPHKDAAIDRELADRWTPVDQYTGGAEHAVLHLLYSRWFTKALNDLGLVGHREPFKRLFNQGQILGQDGERMSKSRGNVQDPDELVERYGADTVRLFLMFMKPWDADAPWDPRGIRGTRRFLDRVWSVTQDRHGHDREASGAGPADITPDAGQELLRLAHRTLRDVTADYEGFRFNTLVAKLMELTNELMRARGTELATSGDYDASVRLLLSMLAPIAPHIAEELWSRRLAAAGEPWRSIHAEAWPAHDEALAAVDQVQLPVQVNGKLRDLVPVAAGASEAEVERIIMARERIRANLEGQEVIRLVHVPGRLVNIVVR